jgi:hypothetical protein
MSCGRIAGIVARLLSLIVVTLAAQAETSTEQAWALLEGAAHSATPSVRLAGVRALGLIPHPRARKLAERALEDARPEVRIAAAGALGQMRAVSSVPLLEKLTADKDFSVVLAAAHALYVLKNPGGYEVYYALLTGQRKSGEGLIAEQMQTLHDPAKMAKLGLEQGIGYVPFAGMGWDALRALMKKDPSPARAVAASILADDPDPASAQALAAATKDKNWIIRLAAVDALARRGNPELQEKIEPLLWDKKFQVRYAAAGALLRLDAIAEDRKWNRKK